MELNQSFDFIIHCITYAIIYFSILMYLFIPLSILAAAEWVTKNLI